jgi:LacI family transcriptional regulator
VATITDVARVAGVSVQTVSAVINDKAGISEATRARIRQIVSDLDYQPNHLASSLRSRRTHTIGILVPSITNPYWPEMVRGVEDLAHREGYVVFLCNTDGDPSKLHTYIRALRRQRVAGLFFSGGGEITDAEIEALVADGIHVVLNDNRSRHEKIVTVHVDDHRGGFDATTHLLDLGHQRIAIIAPLETAGSGRREGYLAALSDRGITADSELMITATFDMESGQRGARRLLALPSMPSAIVAGNDMIAIGVISALKQQGKRVPQDVAVIGFDNIPIAALYDPALTTIAQPLYEMGASAMQAILDRVRNPALPGVSLTFATPLIVRRSTVATANNEEEPQPGAAPDTRTPVTGVERPPALCEEVVMK